MAGCPTTGGPATTVPGGRLSAADGRSGSVALTTSVVLASAGVGGTTLPLNAAAPAAGGEGDTGTVGVGGAAASCTVTSVVLNADSTAAGGPVASRELEPSWDTVKPAACRLAVAVATWAGDGPNLTARSAGDSHLR